MAGNNRAFWQSVFFFFFFVVNSAESNSLVKDCLHWYTCDWAVVNRKYEDCVKNHEYDKIRQQQKDLVASREQTFEVDVAAMEDHASQVI